MATEQEIVDKLNVTLYGAVIRRVAKAQGGISLTVEKPDSSEIVLTFSATQGVHLETGQVRVTVNLNVDCPGLIIGG